MSDGLVGRCVKRIEWIGAPSRFIIVAATRPVLGLTNERGNVGKGVEDG